METATLPPKPEPASLTYIPPTPPPMGSKVGGEALSDADTQEPVRIVPSAAAVAMPLVEQIDESDAEGVPMPVRKGGSPGSVDGKMRQIIEKINEDSDRSDDEDPLPPDAKVDFGDDEEDEEDGADNPTGEKEAYEVDGADEVGGENVVSDDEPAERAGAGKKEVEEAAPKKKQQRPRKDKVSPAKTIKKVASPKSKGKAVKGKKKDLLQKSKPSVEKKVAASKTMSKASAKARKPDPSCSTKSTGKPLVAKGKSKISAKSSAGPVKLKKTIGKGEKSSEKKAVVKKEDRKATVSTTLSKKAATAGNKDVSKNKKSFPDSKLKAGKSTKKLKGKKVSVKSSDDDSEDAGMVVDSDDCSDVESSASVGNENDDGDVKTPGSKLPILGNLACSSRDGDTSALLDHAVQQLGRYSVVSYGGETSDCHLHAYIIGKDTKRGWGVLQALACGVPLVSDDWLSSSISEGKWQPLDAYRSDRFGQSPRSVDGNVAGNRILEGLRVKSFCEGKDAASVKRLLSLCGARVAETRVDLIVNDTGKVVAGCTNVTKKWLADSIEAGVAIEYEPFAV